jgi:hypothetical protein
MLVTSLVLKTQPGRARSVAELVGQLPGMDQLSVDGDRCVHATWHIPEGQYPQPEAVSEVLRAMSGEILEVAMLDEQETDG